RRRPSPRFFPYTTLFRSLHLAADVPGEYMGRNANFSGKGFAENTFIVTAMPQADFDKWVEEVHATAKPLTEEKFMELLEPGHLGDRKSTRLNSSHVKISY